MRSKVLIAISAILVVMILSAGTCSAGFVLGRLTAPAYQQISRLPSATGMPAPENPETTAPATGSPDIQGTSTPVQPPDGVEELFKPFWEAWQLVHDQYVDQPVDDEKLMQGAIRGMLDSLGDKHTSYMDPDLYRQANLPLQEEYEGIGAFVDTSGAYLKIISPMPDSPAEKGGLKPGDLVTAVDGKDMTGIDGNIVLRSILGPAGTRVRLTIKREGVADLFDVELVRAKIIVQSVTGKMLDNKIAYVQISTFAENTRAELRRTLQSLMDQDPAGLIIDLRNNGGGFLKTAIEVGSEFIDQGVLMYEVYGDGKRDEYKALGKGLATKIPMVVLVNEGSASASEIVAGAIQDYNRAPLVGVTTYGKGSVQIWTALSNNEGAIRVTVARWLTPNERQINEIGLKPDYEVKITDEDIQAGNDPQLDKAVELLITSK
jgi:carboxyl-terminal processing protease